MGSGFPFPSSLLPAFQPLQAAVWPALFPFPNLVCPGHLSVYGAFWPWLVSASSTFFFYN